MKARQSAVHSQQWAVSRKEIAILFSAILFMLVSVANAADVLDIGYGAKSIGLGKTYTSVKGDAYGIFGNPASLRGVTTGEIVSMYGQMNTEVSYTMLGYVMPTKYGKFFAGYGNNAMAGFTATTLDPVTGRPVAGQDFDYRDDLLIAGYQNSMTKQLSYGLRMKYLNKGAGNISGYYANGINADAGMLYEANERLTLGATLRNLIPGQTGALKLGNGQYEEQTTGVDVGLGFQAHPKLNLYTDLSMNRSIPTEVRVGAEWKPTELLAIRLGGEQKNSGGNTSYLNGSAGIGLSLGMFTIDYAYSYDSLIQSNSRHFISLSLKTSNVTALEPVFATAMVKTESVIIEVPENPAIPEVERSETEDRKTEVIEYTVVEGDWLSKIAQRYLGDMMKYPELAELNNIMNPDLIYPGQKIKIKH